MRGVGGGGRHTAVLTLGDWMTAAGRLAGGDMLVMVLLLVVVTGYVSSGHSSLVARDGDGEGGAVSYPRGVEGYAPSVQSHHFSADPETKPRAA